MLADPLAALRQATEANKDERSNDIEQTVHSALSAFAPQSFGPAEAKQSTETPADVDQNTASTKSKLSVAPIKPIATTTNPTRNTVYLYPEDLTQLRKISGWLAIEHGIRANDSMIVRACLALADRDVRLLHAIRETALSDRRRTKSQA